MENAFIAHLFDIVYVDIFSLNLVKLQDKTLRVYFVGRMALVS